MGLRLALCAALLVALAAPADAARRSKTRFDALRDCERSGNAQFLRHNAMFRRFVIDRSNVTIDRYADYIGNQFVSAIYHGRAVYEAGAGPRNTRFICLHGGMGRRAVFVYTLPD